MDDVSVERLAEPRRLRTSLDRRKLLDPNVASSRQVRKDLLLGKGGLRPHSFPIDFVDPDSALAARLERVRLMGDNQSEYRFEGQRKKLVSSASCPASVHMPKGDACPLHAPLHAQSYPVLWHPCARCRVHFPQSTLSSHP
jgi:hypothetical protein